MNTFALPGIPTPVPVSRVVAALSADELRRHAPSIFAEHAKPGVSSRYSFVSTAQVIDLLADEGWVPVKASEQAVRLDTRRGFQMHELRFARLADLAAGAMLVGATRPELILQNAHDGSRAYRIDAGLYRLVCKNGLTVADTAFAHVSIRHVDVSPEEFVRAARSVAESTPRMIDAVARWQAVTLSPEARRNFAQRAARVRWHLGQPVATMIRPEDLLRPLRRADESADLWATYNVVQEHLIRGGDRVSGIVPGWGLRRSRTRAVQGLAETQRINKGLWALAEEYGRN